MSTYLFDTDILIDAARGEQAAIDSLSRYAAQGRLSVSVVMKMEMIIGCRDKDELRKLNQFLHRFEIFLLQEVTTNRAADLVEQYWLSHSLKIADAFIAATAIQHGPPFFSKNQKDYRFISDLDLRPYPPATSH